MMIHTWGSWKMLLLIAVSWLLAAALLFLGAWGSLTFLTAYIGKDNFPALTTLVAVIGSLIAIIQFQSVTQEKRQTRARALAFTSQLANEAGRLLWRPLPQDYTGDVPNPFLLPPNVIANRRLHLEEIARSAAALDVKEMPSVESMAALIELKAAMRSLADLLAIETEEPVDFEDPSARIMLASNRLGKERDALYPTYKIGKAGLIQSAVERR
jgi:hypothetical protein